MDDCCVFQPKIQVDCILDMLRIVRSGDLLAAKAELLEHAGCVLGCFGAYLKKPIDPVEFFASTPDDLPTTLEECAKELESVFAVTRSGDETGARMTPQVAALIMKLVIFILARLVS